MLALRTHDITILGGMNGKVSFKKFLLEMNLVHGENDEMSIPNSGERSRLNNVMFRR